jgi:hypothetical protein
MLGAEFFLFAVGAVTTLMSRPGTRWHSVSTSLVVR